jgi:polyphenol oxidase
MLRQLSKDVCVLTLFTQFPKLRHGFSTRHIGTMNSRDPNAPDNLKQFANILQINSTSIVRMEQEHSTNILQVTAAEKEKQMPKTDGMYTADSHVFLGVVTADCVPVLIYDPVKEFIAVAHAGWRGVYNGIVPKLLKELMTNGSKNENIYVGLGPSIRTCCYTIDNERATMFRTRYPDLHDLFLSENEGMIHCSLQKLLITQIESAGVATAHIDDANVCTKDAKNIFYSYRFDKREPIDEFIGIIGRV